MEAGRRVFYRRPAAVVRRLGLVAAFIEVTAESTAVRQRTTVKAIADKRVGKQRLYAPTAVVPLGMDNGQGSRKVRNHSLIRLIRADRRKIYAVGIHLKIHIFL